MTAILKCGMKKACHNPVTHVGSKGYVYCSTCAPDRKGCERTRQMRSWELKLLQSGQPIIYEVQSKATFFSKIAS